jgi:hypothetical protein
VRRLIPFALLAILLGLVPSQAVAAEPWTTRVFARVAAPGFPAYVHVHPNGRVYAGTYSNPAGDRMRSRWNAVAPVLTAAGR